MEKLKKQIPIIGGLLFWFGLQSLTGQIQNVACGNSIIRYSVKGQVKSTFSWIVKGGKILKTYASGDSIDIQWNNVKEEHSLSAKEILEGGCEQPPITLKINVFPISLEIPDTMILCEGSTIEFSVKGKFNDCVWNDTLQGSSISISSPGSYQIKVNNEICSLVDTLIILSAPPPHVFIGNDTMISYPDRLLLYAGNEGLQYLWSNGSQDQTLWVDASEGKVWVTVWDEDNCVSSDTIQILTDPSQPLIIPNVFSPNGDGINDTWKIGGIAVYPKAIIRIFDRAGHQVFLSLPGYPHAWDGKDNGKKLAFDAYYYMIDPKNGDKPMSGYLILIP